MAGIESMGARGLSRVRVASGAAVVAATVGFGVLRLTAPCIYLCDKSWRGGDPNAVLRRVTFFELPTALRLGLAVGFVVLVGATVWSERRRDPLAVGAAAAMTWIMVTGFVQGLLYNLDFNVFTDQGNAFWTISYLIATTVVLGYLAKKIVDGIGDPAARKPVDSTDPPGSGK